MGRKVVRLSGAAAAVGLLLCACGHGAAQQPAPSASIVPSDLNAQIDLRPTDISARRGTAGHLMPMDSPGNDIDSFDFTATNKSAKIIAAFDASVVLANSAGAVLYRGRLQESAILEPSRSFTIHVTVVNDPASLPNPELVRAASARTAHLRYRIEDISYADGTKVHS